MRKSKLTLNRVTLLGVDLFDPFQTLISIWFCRQQVLFSDSVIVVSKPFNDLRGVRQVIYPHGSGKDERGVREMFLVRDLWRAFETDFALLVDNDGYVANPSAWDDTFLDYDFIGAPWPWPYEEPHCVPCHSMNCVGNTGFCLISRRMSKAAGSLRAPTPEELIVSDGFLCRTLRPELEAQGIRFAPEALAERFSCENRIYSGQFGLHGKRTEMVNGLNFRI